MGESNEALIDGVVVAADALSGTGLPAGSMMKATVQLLTSFMHRLGANRANRAFWVFVERWAAAHGLPDDQAAVEVRRLLRHGHPEHDDGLYEMFRHMAQSRSETSWPYMARLTAEYILEDRPTDTFFRRCGRLLESCEERDIEVLVAVLTQSALALASAGAEEDPLGVTWSLYRPGGGDVTKIEARVSTAGKKEVVRRTHADLAAPDSGALTELLVLVDESRLAERRDGHAVYFSLALGRLQSLIRLFDAKAA